MTEHEEQPPTEVVESTGFEVPTTPEPRVTFPFQRDVLIHVPARHRPKLQAILDRINADDELYMWWQCANINAVSRLGMSDHGPVHVQIVANIALRLERLLAGRGVVSAMVETHGLTEEEAEIVVVLGALLHDVGMSIHRNDHERFSLILAAPKLRELLDGIYDVATRTVIASEVLHTIIAHRSDGRPLTIEAGIVRVADALDMSKGRSRTAFEAGQINIHSLSAAAIDRIEIQVGELKPVRIIVAMLNSAGIFQLDELLKEKLHGSGLEPYVEVEARIEGDTERKLLEVFRV